MLRESKVTVKIPRPLYRKIQHVIEGSGFSSPTDFIVFVLRDLVGEADGEKSGAEKADKAAKGEYSPAELDEIKRKLKNLGYL
ncbi:MAG: ribbon-helix-helix domain-containing protein [Planctomycetes bacterium]|nr:ribbon-helix-helix domain-containing protein [Planctomycetota bacterium]